MALLNGSFYFKNLPDGSLDRSKVICAFCQTEFKYHRSTSSLSYHLRAKHPGVTNSAEQTSQRRLQSSILGSTDGHRPEVNRQPDRLPAALSQWAAIDRRSVDRVDVSGLRDVFRLAPYDQVFAVPAQGSVSSSIQDETERAIKQELLESEDIVPISGDHWTSGNGGGDDQEQGRDEKEQLCPQPVVSTSHPLVESHKNNHQDIRVSLKRRRWATTETEIHPAEALTNFRDDDDELFLLSLLPSLKRLTLKKRMEVRLKFQQVLFDAEFED